MLSAIRFHNFRVLRQAEIKLGRCNVIVGPNGCGKSTVLQAISLATTGKPAGPGHEYVSLGDRCDPAERTSVHFVLDVPTLKGHTQSVAWVNGNPQKVRSGGDTDAAGWELLSHARCFAFVPREIAAPCKLMPGATLDPSGFSLALVVDRLRDQSPERFEELDAAVGSWFPEFDRVVFDTTANGQRVIGLRTRDGKVPIYGSNLSDGTLIGLALLTLAYLPDPPKLIGLEEPDRGLHPRLLRSVRDAINRLCYPEQFGEAREPVQVVATTHNPLFLDLFKDTPEEVIIASRRGADIVFENLAQQPNIEEILSGAPLGEVWYSGILGGVPASP